MTIQISEEQIKRMLAEGIQHAVNSMLRDSYGNGALLKKAMEKAITESEPDY